MTSTTVLKAVLSCVALAGAAAASAHVTLPPGGATVGTDYDAAFRVGHACQGAKATTGISVELPRGFVLLKAEPRPGWTLNVRDAVSKNGPLGRPGDVSWRADTPEAALPGGQKAEFIVRGKLPSTPGVLWFQVRQVCDVGQTDWAQLPTDATPAEGLKSPAARLDVLPVGVAAVDVKDAWMRAAVPGQSGTGAFMKLNAPSGARLVGASTPAAGSAEVHEMKMDGDTMRMREVKGGIELPARQTVELKPGGFHLMLTDLKQPIVKGATVPVTLNFEDARGAKSTLEVKVPVALAPPGGGDAGSAHQH